MHRIKRSGLKKSHKIVFTILSLIGMLGLIFGVSVFLVLGNSKFTKADTKNSAVITDKKDKENNQPISLKTSVDSSTEVSVAQPSVKVDQETLTKSEDQVSYTVQEGDTLSRIAEHYQVSLSAIMQQNNLKSENEIYIGQVLVFLKSYTVKEVAAEIVEMDNIIAPGNSPEISINNGNKVATGGLSDAERLSVLTQLQTRTGIPASQWDYIISRESGWIPTIKNSIGYYGLFQLAPTYPGYDGDVQAQIEGALYLFNRGGMAHWAL